MTRRVTAIRWHMLICLCCFTPCLAAAPAIAADASLHERIDALVESVAVGPTAPLASDAEFLRRVYLDLNGTIPDAQTARAFLDDPSPNKRELLIDRLLDRPHYARQMQKVFDVMWTERRPEKGIPAADWQEYLRKSFEDNKPLDQLAREVLAADGVDPVLRPAAKFYLDREGEPNLVARDIGRLFFGRDLQCAQCHDHPLVDDYLQSDYYGLLAFVNRGVLFTDKAKVITYAEKADGEVSFKSVFTGNARDLVLPQLPQGPPVSEPRLAKEEQYVVAPAEGVRPVPKYSRRAQLAAGATNGANQAFNRNFANRLWATMMGRGLAHPLDVVHSNNPSVQSQLLDLLSDEFVKAKFDVKKFLRELALSKAYQRASEAPRPADLKLDPATTSPLLVAWKADADRLESEFKVLEAASAKAFADASAAYEKVSKCVQARDAAQKLVADAKKASDDAGAALAAAIKDVSGKEEVSRLLAEGGEKAKAAAEKLPADKPLADAAALLATRRGEIETQLVAARKLAGERAPLVQAASLKLAEADQAAQAPAAEFTIARAALDTADKAHRDALDRTRDVRGKQRELAKRFNDGQAALGFLALAAAADASQAAARTAGEQLATAKAQPAGAASLTAEQLAQAEQAAKAAAEKAAAEQTARDQAWTALLDHATQRFTLAPLKPLSPEQLAWGTMQAVGQVDAQLSALAPQAKKDAEAIANLADAERARAEAKLLEKAVDEKLRGNLGAFVSLFGQQPGQAPTFQATVHQALFFANGGLLAGWINPGGNNLTERLSKIAEPSPLAEELYLSVLSRRPSSEEQTEVAAYLSSHGAERPAAVREMVWSLLSSAEFRFNH